MVLFLRLVSLLLAVLCLAAIFSILAATKIPIQHGIGEKNPEKMELITSSNYTQTKNLQKRQSYYGEKPTKHPYRDSKHDYIDEHDRDGYMHGNDRPFKPVYDTESEQNLSSSYPIYRSSFPNGHGGGGGGGNPYYGGFPGTGFGFGGPGAAGGAVGTPYFGPGPLNPIGGVGGHAVGHSFSILDPLFLMITLSFILFLVHSILGLVDRVRLPILKARSEDGAIDIEFLDNILMDFKQAIDKYGTLNDLNQNQKTLQLKKTKHDRL